MTNSTVSVPGYSPDCDDGNLVSVDACANGVCVSVKVTCDDTTPDPLSNCDDGNLCTIDTLENGTCVYANVVCPSGYGCDPSDGQCVLINALIPGVAVIDEADNDSNAHFDREWANFRANYPRRPFCLLQPALSTNGLYRPPAFDADPLTRFSLVNRDNNDTNMASDWFKICGLDTMASADVDYVGLFVDNSGSMFTSNVQASYDKFLTDLTNHGLTFRTLENGREDWIEPFMVDFV